MAQKPIAPQFGSRRPRAITTVSPKRDQQTRATPLQATPAVGTRIRQGVYKRRLKIQPIAQHATTDAKRTASPSKAGLERRPFPHRDSSPGAHRCMWVQSSENRDGANNNGANNNDNDIHNNNSRGGEIPRWVGSSPQIWPMLTPFLDQIDQLRTKCPSLGFRSNFSTSVGPLFGDFGAPAPAAVAALVGATFGSARRATCPQLWGHLFLAPNLGLARGAVVTPPGG